MKTKHEDVENIGEHDIKQVLGERTSEGDWENVKKLYSSDPKAHTTRVDDSKRTALHVALDKNEHQVAQALIEAIVNEKKKKKEKEEAIVNEKKKEEEEDPLAMKNDRGDTPLHVAASKGLVRVCKLILEEKEERKELVRKKNNKGETPLFVAALNWNRKRDVNKYTVAYLIDVHKSIAFVLDDVVRKDGDSVLHLAIQNQYFDLAMIILHYYHSLCTYTNTKGITPLKALAAVPSAFRSGTNIFGWSLILYHWIIVALVDPVSAKDRYSEMESEENIRYIPKNYTLLLQVIRWGKSRIKARLLGVSTVNSNHTQEKKYSYRGWLPPNYGTLREFINALVAGFVGLFGLGRFGYDSVKTKKEAHKWSRQLLRELLKKPYAEAAIYGHRINIPTDYDRDMYRAYYQGESSGSNEISLPPQAHEKTESAFVIAARNGIVEMVKDILHVMPNAIYEKSLDDENVFVVAVKYRQAFVFEELKKHQREEILEDFISGEVDKKGNTILHLAAQVPSGDQPGQIVGVALQMMWDTKWYEYIQDQVPRHYQLLHNTGGKTPIQIFQEQHQRLISEGSGWLKDTSESCSVVAALIAGVSFATACTVPGGNNNGGNSPFEDEPAFNAFAISSLIGLCFSVTALTMFLSILTSRKSAKDFRGSLPRKLLVGLSSLFISIVAMFVSFCSGHYFLIQKSYKGILFLLYGATALPVIFFAMAQFPLYYDLLVTFLSQDPHKAKGIGTSL